MPDSICTAAQCIYKYCTRVQIDLPRRRRGPIRAVEASIVARALGEFEQLILLAVMRLGDDAYGVTIKREIERRTGREIFIGAVYTALGRLHDNGYLSSEVSEPTAKRGGRRRKHYRLEADGEAALARSHRAYTSMIEGIEGDLDTLAARRPR